MSRGRGIEPRVRFPMKGVDLAAVAGVAAPALASFVERDGGDDECARGVRPPPACERVEQETGEQREGEVGADLVLPCLAHGRG
jgi:hypothetical protein